MVRVNTRSRLSTMISPRLLVFRYGEEEHVLDVGGRHDPSALADRPHWSNPDLLSYLGADNGLCLMLTLRGFMVREVGMKPVPEKLFNHREVAVVLALWGSRCMSSLRHDIVRLPMDRAATVDGSDPQSPRPSPTMLTARGWISS